MLKKKKRRKEPSKNCKGKRGTKKLK